MAGDASIGTFGKFAVDDSAVTAIGDFDSGSFSYEFLSTDLRRTTTATYNDGIRGTRSRAKERVRRTAIAVSGGIVMNPTPVELDQWLPRILGTNESADSFVLAETVPVFGVLIERELKRYVYTGCKVNAATFSCSQGGLMNLRVDIEGQSEIESATSWPGTIPVIDSGAPFIMADTTFQLAADTSCTQVREWEITVNNFLNTDRYMNSVTRQPLHALDREVTLRLVVPYNSDSADLVQKSVPGSGGTLTMTNGNTSTLFTFANLTGNDETPPIPGKEELFLNLQFTAYTSSTTKELVVTHDSTP